MDNRRVVVYGAGDYAKVFYYEVVRTEAIKIDAFCVDEEFYKEGLTLFDIPIYSVERIREYCSPNNHEMLVLCGYVNMRLRKKMFDNAKRQGYVLGNYISPDACVEKGVIFGENNIVFSNSFVGANGRMGDDNIIRQNVYLGHDFLIGNHNIISAGSTIGGNCRFFDLTFCGLGVTVINSITVGNENLIGAGSVVVKNTDDYSKNVGVPSRTIDFHEATGVIVNINK